MSITSEIERLQNAKASIKAAIENKGVTVGNGTIDTYANKINEITAGGTEEVETHEDLVIGLLDRSYPQIIDTTIFGDKLTFIGDNALRNCNLVTGVVFSEYITKINSNATTGMNAAGMIEFCRNEPPTSASVLFTSTSTSTFKYIIVPADSITAYSEATNYSKIAPYMTGKKFFNTGETISSSDSKIVNWYETPENAVKGTNPLSSLVATESKYYYGGLV